MKRIRSKAALSWLCALALAAGALGLPLPVFAQDGAAREDVTIAVVHTNDVHARVDIEPYAAALVKEKKAAGENVLLLSAGDVFQGLPLATLSRGYSIGQIMNAAGYDAMVPGNHEFNYGFERLATLAEELKFPVLAANITRKATGELPFAPYLIKEFDGVKVGIFGLAAPETVRQTSPSHVEAVQFEFPYNVAKRTIQTLQNEGCQAIIALSHLGVDRETWAEERSTYLAGLPGLDLIVDGHSHTPMAKKIEGTMVVQTGGMGETIGVVEMTVSGGRVRRIKPATLAVPTQEAPNPDLTPDPAVARLIDRINAANEKVLSRVVATVGVDLEGERELVRTQETNLGNLISDAMLAHTGADIAINNGGNIRASISKGNVTKGDIITVLPFGNYIVTKKMTGKQVVEALEHGVSIYPEQAAWFLHVSGITFAFDPSAPAGRRVVKAVLAGGAPIDPTATYTVATNDFLAEGGDDYPMIGEAGGAVNYDALDQVVTDYLRANPAVKPGPEGRITVAKKAVAA